MKVRDLVECDSMHGALFIVEGDRAEEQITGINVLEAPDIEHWGRPGLAILSSFYALQDLSDEELDAFFLKLEDTGISALIIKVNRLVPEIPTRLVDLCRAHGIPLIQIDLAVNYQDVIAEVLGNLLASRERQLSLHYRLSNIASQMSLDLLSVPEILAQFRGILGADLTLVETRRGTIQSTLPAVPDVTLGARVEMPHSGYMNFTYSRHRYAGTDGRGDGDARVVAVDISCIEERQHLLLVHEPIGIRALDQETVDTRVVIVENLIRCVQTALLREFAATEQQMMRRSAIVGDLMTGMISGPTEQTAAFEALGVDPADDCRVLTIEYHVPGERQTLQYTNVRTRIRWRLQARYPNALFYVGPSFLQAIITGKPDRNIDLPVHATAALIRGILEDEGVEADFQFYGGISEQRPVREIAQAGLESRATARFLRSNGEPNTVEGFEDLGVLRLFVQSGQMDLRAYVPREILDFHNEFPDLYETLRVYMRSRQSLKKTAETLGLHPKTVKYRLSRIRSRLDIDLDDARQVTVLLTSFEIIQFVTEGIGDDHHLHPA